MMVEKNQVLLPASRHASCQPQDGTKNAKIKTKQRTNDFNVDSEFLTKERIAIQMKNASYVCLLYAYDLFSFAN